MKKVRILIAVAIVLILCYMICSCVLSDRILAEKMIMYYSNDDNYVTVTGTVVEVKDASRVEIKSPELDVLKYGEDINCIWSCSIYSTDALNIEVGAEIVFVTTLMHFYNGDRLPIVQITLNGEMLFPFTEGRSNLVGATYDWLMK